MLLRNLLTKLCRFEVNFFLFFSPVTIGISTSSPLFINTDNANHEHWKNKAVFVAE